MPSPVLKQQDSRKRFNFMDEDKLKEVNVFIKMKYEKQYIDKKSVAEIQNNFDNIFDSKVDVKLEDIEIKKKED